ncbi:hypothetical protein ES702_03129 [subsurface metagenome]
MNGLDGDTTWNSTCSLDLIWFYCLGHAFLCSATVPSHCARFRYPRAVLNSNSCFIKLNPIKFLASLDAIVLNLKL